MIEDDKLIDVAQRGFLKLAADREEGATASAASDLRGISDISRAIAHNLRLVASVLGDRSSDDDSATLRRALHAVAKDQTTALNLVAGISESAAFAHMQGDLPQNNVVAMPTPPQTSSDAATAYRAKITAAGISDPVVLDLPALSMEGGLQTGSVYAVAERALAALGSARVRDEARVTRRIIRTARGCS